MSNAIKTLGAAFFAVGLVAAHLVLAGCGAPEDDNVALGQTEEAASSSEALLHQLFGTDTGSGIVTHRMQQCTDNGSTLQDCRWVRPYQSAVAQNRPARISINTNATLPDGPALRADAVSISNALNGQLHYAGTPPEVGYDVIIDQAASGSGLSIQAGPDTHVASGSTHVADYMSLVFNGCQSAAEQELPSQPGAFRSCQFGSCNIDVLSMHRNRPASFAGDLKQLVGACLLSGLGAGVQGSVSNVLNFSAFSSAAQSAALPLSASQATQLRQAQASEFNPGGSSIYSVPCQLVICIP